MRENKHIRSDSQSEFSFLIASIKEGNKVAVENLLFVALRVIETWCRHSKIEADWMAVDGKLNGPEKILPVIIRKYTENHGLADECSFKSFREFLVEEYRSELLKGFECFIELLKKDDPHAWRLIFNNLEKKAALWFYKKTHIFKDDFRSLYCESIELVHQNLSKKELQFSDSSKFKSYFFRVLENKFLEYSRDSYSRRSKPIEEAGKSVYLVQEPSDAVEEDENRALLARALQKLDPDEKYILTEYYFCERKLTEIADEMKISEGNIRIRKYRALQKLSGFLITFGYGS